jgi:ribosomal protein S27AE
MYFESDTNGESIGEPYCSKCWEAEKLAIHLKHIEELRFVCPNCENSFGPRPKSWEKHSTSFSY